MSNTSSLTEDIYQIFADRWEGLKINRKDALQYPHTNSIDRPVFKDSSVAEAAQNVERESFDMSVSCRRVGTKLKNPVGDG